MSPAGSLPRTGISFGTLRSAVEYGLPFFTFHRNCYSCRSPSVWQWVGWTIPPGGPEITWIRGDYQLEHRLTQWISVSSCLYRSSDVVSCAWNLLQLTSLQSNSTSPHVIFTAVFVTQSFCYSVVGIVVVVIIATKWCCYHCSCFWLLTCSGIGVIFIACDVRCFLCVRSVCWQICHLTTTALPMSVSVISYVSYSLFGQRA